MVSCFAKAQHSLPCSGALPIAGQMENEISQSSWQDPLGENSLDLGSSGPAVPGMRVLILQQEFQQIPVEGPESCGLIFP